MTDTASTPAAEAPAQTPGHSTWSLDPAHSAAEFSARHMMISTVRGAFHKVEGTVELDEVHPENSTVTATIEAASIDSRQADRDTHLRSADFLDVEHYPTITFKSTKIEPHGKDDYLITGDLTIRGTTHAVTLDTKNEGRGKNPWGKEIMAFHATTKINRKDWGLNWNVALEAGGVLVSEEVKIEVFGELIRQ
jgi:polyisoprenoid-binding protein YceI